MQFQKLPFPILPKTRFEYTQGALQIWCIFPKTSSRMTPPNGKHCPQKTFIPVSQCNVCSSPALYSKDAKSLFWNFLKHNMDEYNEPSQSKQKHRKHLRTPETGFCQFDQCIYLKRNFPATHTQSPQATLTKPNIQKPLNLNRLGNQDHTL